MSRPATSCSRRYTDSVSTYCSRNRLVTIASKNERVPRFSVYQLGRGREPVTVVGSILSKLALNIMSGESSKRFGAGLLFGRFRLYEYPPGLSIWSRNSHRSRSGETFLDPLRGERDRSQADTHRIENGIGQRGSHRCAR